MNRTLKRIPVVTVVALAAEAAERKAELADADVPGYKGRAFGGGKHRR